MQIMQAGNPRPAAYSVPSIAASKDSPEGASFFVGNKGSIFKLTSTF